MRQLVLLSVKLEYCFCSLTDKGCEFLIVICRSRSISCVSMHMLLCQFTVTFSNISHPPLHFYDKRNVPLSHFDVFIICVAGIDCAEGVVAHHSVLYRKYRTHCL